MALKYCGACNPDVDIHAIGRRIRELVGDSTELGRLASGDADLIVILNGCGVACADRPDVREQARAAIVVAGESVALRPVREAEIAERVAQVIEMQLDAPLGDGGWLATPTPIAGRGDVLGNSERPGRPAASFFSANRL